MARSTHLDVQHRTYVKLRTLKSNLHRPVTTAGAEQHRRCLLGPSTDCNTSQRYVLPQVYAKLAAIKAWNDWNESTWVLHAPGQEQLAAGDNFSYTAPFVLGNVQAEVQHAAQTKVCTAC